MPSVLMIISLVVQAYFLYHAYKNTCCGDRWVIYLILIPAIGPALYFVLFYLPMELTQGEKQKLNTMAINLIDPHRDYKTALAAYQRTPVVETKHTLARVMIRRNELPNAIGLLKDILTAPFGEEANVYQDLAYAYIQQGSYTPARDAIARGRSLTENITKQAEFDLLSAQLEENAGNTDAAERIYRSLLDILPGQEVRCRLARLMLRQNRVGEARNMSSDVIERIRLAPALYRKQQRDWDKAARDMLKQAS